MINKKNYITMIVMLTLLLIPINVKADWAGCYSELSDTRAYSENEIITYELGSKGVTSNQSISGFRYHIEYDPTVLEPVMNGAGNYWDWGKVNLEIKNKSSIRFNTLIADVQTFDKTKMVTSDLENSNSDNFVKLGYVKFKVINTEETSTKLTLVQSYEEDKYSSTGSKTSYKYIWLYDTDTKESYRYDYEDEYDYQEPCFDTVTTFVKLYKKAFINNIIINNSVIKNYDKNTYQYNLKYTDKTIDISANSDEGYIISGDVGKKTLNYGNNIFKISVTSPTGDRKDYTLNINHPDSRNDDNTLKSLVTSNGSIEFKPEINEYDIEVDYEVDKISINSELTNAKSSYVKNYGNREVNLEVGKNVVEIKVQSEKGIENIYKLNILRKEATNTCDIKALKIKGYILNFDSNKNNYTLDIDYKINKLDINVILVNNESKYKIIGNENLTNGSRINIKVTDINNKEKDYYINITKDMTIPEKQKNKMTIIIFTSIIGIGLVGTVGLILFLNKNNKAKEISKDTI